MSRALVQRVGVTVAASLAAAVIAACGAQGSNPQWSDPVDSMYAGWSGSLIKGSGGTLLKWVPLTSDGLGSLHLVSDDGSIEPLGEIHRGALAVSPSGEVFAAADPALGANPGIDIIEARTGERRRKIDGLTDDRQWENLFFTTETRVVWTTHIEVDEEDNLVYRLVESDLLPRQSTTLGTSSDIDAMELSPDRSRLAFAGSPKEGDPHGLWIVDLKTHDLVEVDTGGVDVQFIAWPSDDERFLEAKNRAQAPATGSGRGDADDFLTERDVRPGGIYRWTDTKIVPLDIDFEAYEPGEFSVSPDHSTLAVAAWRKDNEGFGVSSLWIVDVASQEARKVTTGKDHAGDGAPALFSPDGRLVVLQRGRQLHVVNVVSGVTTKLNPHGTWGSLTSIRDVLWADDSLLFFSNMGDTKGNRSQAGRLKLWRWQVSNGSMTVVATRPGCPPTTTDPPTQ